MKLKNKKIVVIGGAGFIGSNLADLLCPGNDVIVIDSLLHGNKLEKNSPVKLVQQDITRFKKLPQVLESADYVFYLASKVGVDVVKNHAFETIDTEIKGIQQVITASLKANVKKIVYASSSSVYGKEITKRPAKETDPASPTSSYAVAKLACEYYLQSVFEENGLATSSVRIFNAYGPRQDNRMVVPRFFELARQNKDLIVFENGKQTRDFTFVSDVCKGLVTIACSSKTNGETINIATGTETTINALGQKIIQLTESNSRIVHEKKPDRSAFEVSRRFGNPAKLFSLCGFKPQTTLQEGLQKIWKNTIPKNLK